METLDRTIWLCRWCCCKCVEKEFKAVVLAWGKHISHLVWSHVLASCFPGKCSTGLTSRRLSANVWGRTGLQVAADVGAQYSAPEEMRFSRWKWLQYWSENIAYLPFLGRWARSNAQTHVVWTGKVSPLYLSRTQHSKFIIILWVCIIIPNFEVTGSSSELALNRSCAIN